MIEIDSKIVSAIFEILTKFWDPFNFKIKRGKIK